MAVLEGIEAGFLRSAGYKGLLAALRKGKLPVAAFELCEGARAMLCAVLAGGKRALLICPSDLRALSLAQDLRALGLRARHLPAREQSFHHASAESRDLAQARIAVLGDALTEEGPAIVCAPIEALLQPLGAPERFKEAILELRPGVDLPIETLSLRLVEAGYRREEAVEGKGQFAVRGGIVDLFPVQAESACRIEFWGNEIDTMREMDAMTQRSTGQLKELKVYPSSEAVLSPEEARAALERLSAMLKKQKEAQKGPSMPWLEPGEDEEDEPLGEAAQKRPLGTPEELEGFLPLLGETKSALDYLLPELILLEEPGRVRQSAADAAESFVRELQYAIERGEGIQEQRQNLMDYGLFMAQALKFPLVALGNLRVAVPDLRFKALCSIPARETPDFMGQQQLLQEKLEELRREGYEAALFAGGRSRAERLSQSLLSNGFESAPFRVLPEAFSRGFELPEAKLAVLGDSDLFGSARQRGASKRRRSGRKIAAFTDLKPGDYVVHENHGVGLYLGTERLSVQGASRDYLNIQYGGKDKLYVPTDQLDRVQKYIGAADAPPRLNRLGGGDWERAKQRVKTSLLDMAKELAELYAKRQAIQGHAFAKDSPWQREFEDAFPYEETPDQLQSAIDIKADMERRIVMDRLLCGDVGYGKTEVAMRAAFKAVIESKQVAVLVPTTILAQQHFENFKKRFANFPVRIEMLSRFRSAAEQRQIAQKAQRGEIDILIGTHRLLGRDLRFKDLGLLIVDEEQRFGVKHKESLKQMKASVDVLTLSATPIPRTLHMSMAGIRDMSLIETPPEERYPVQTYVLEYSDALLRDAVRRELARGGQVYILYNRVRSIERFHSHVSSLVPEARIAIGHGQMPENELENAMLDFYEGSSDVLICSTIIESGLDVQNANTLIVMDADRFGLSQLYQLRGRVGRSNRLAYCYMTLRPDKVITEQAEKRLSAIREFTEFGAGFKIAMRDLEIRGAGNLLGAQQHGHMSEIGYDLYVRMMEETVREIKGEPIENRSVEARVELRLDAFLPLDFVRGDALRMDVYKRIATVRTREDFSEVLDELIDRFGELPPEAERLLWIALFKSRLEALGLDLAVMRGNQLVMRFSALAALDFSLLVGGLLKAPALSLQNTNPPCLLLRAKGEPERLMQAAILALEGLEEGMKG
ncbi:MAG: transcription-repair coupling factor [Christensenellaceae bacterium]|nr:transcription-repair coupling factor [Christensenellaceae bacterium]